MSEIIPYTGDPDLSHSPVVYSLRSDDYRYIQWRDPKDHRKIIFEELYDQRNSLEAKRNLVEVADYRNTLRDHRELMKREYPDY